MNVTIKYFASLREKLNLTEEKIDLPMGIHNGEQLKQFLSSRGEVWQQVFNSTQTIQIAINQLRASWQDDFSENDEIALFPPVTGG
ncbi:MAG: molybdopterin converting factor subunit 1 [Betaproteobacteria bacterium]|nr:molybdopterin converting factor subunit 1 [Betaproteobacteria bacterium]